MGTICNVAICFIGGALFVFDYILGCCDAARILEDDTINNQQEYGGGQDRKEKA